MANEAAVTQAVDAVEEANVGPANLDEWAARDDETPVTPEPAKEVKPEPAPKKAAKKGADAIAARGGEAPKPAPKAEAKTPPARPYDPAAKVKIVVDGEEEEITLEEALRRARKNSAADKRFQEASRLRQEAEPLRALEPFRGMFEQADIDRARALLRERGQDPGNTKALRAALGEIVVLEQIEREKLEKENPSELKRREAEAKLREMEAKQKADEQARAEEERERYRQQARETYNRQFTSALQKSGLPATPYTVMRMAELMQENLRGGLELTADEIVPLVREDLSKEASSVIGKLDVAQAVKVLPKGFLDALRKYDLEQAKGGGDKTSPRPPAPLGTVPQRPASRRGERFTKPRDAQEALEKWAERG